MNDVRCKIGHGNDCRSNSEGSVMRKDARAGDGILI